MLCLSMAIMAPILWGALLTIRGQHRIRSLDGGSAQMAVGRVGQLDGGGGGLGGIQRAVVIMRGGETKEGIDGESRFL